MDEKSFNYQFRILDSEIEHWKRRADDIPDFVYWIVVNSRRLYWTVTRLIGLGHLHDGSRRPPPQRTIAFSIDASKVRTTRRIFMDLSSTAHSPSFTGIQRVMRELSTAGVERGYWTPVVAKDGRFEAMGGEKVEFRDGDILLLLDSSWPDLPQVLPAVTKAHERGAKIVLGLYDLIPFDYPGLVMPSTSAEFSAWFREIVPLATSAIGISRTTALDFRDWLAHHPGLARPDLQVGWFHLGADFARNVSAPSAAVSALLRAHPDYFVAVGTIEPRKCHATILDAFEERWRAGDTSAFVIAGRKGWRVESLAARIREHAEFGRRLFWFDHPSDADIAALYKGARSFIIASIAEGFGLPLVEAAHYGAPVIASDIAVFRELAGDQISYFEPLDASDLARCIAAADQPRRPPALGERSWGDAVEDLFKMVEGADYTSAHAGWLAH